MTQIRPGEGKNEDCIKYFEESAIWQAVAEMIRCWGYMKYSVPKELEDYIILKDSSTFKNTVGLKKDDKRAMKYLKRAAENEDA